MPAAIKFKVQATGSKSAMVVAYIDARLAIERLNMLVPELWSDRYEPYDGKHTLCHLTVGDITRSDVGNGQGKAGYSDALKRAAVKFGIGVSLYAIPQRFLPFDSAYLEKRGNNWAITPDGDGMLRSWYRTWLAEHGEQNFGPALDHGDVDVSVGDPDEPVSSGGGSAAGPEPEGPLLQTAEANALREDAKEAWLALTGLIGKSAYPPAQYQAELRDAGHSIELLTGFVEQLRERLADEANR